MSLALFVEEYFLVTSLFVKGNWLISGIFFSTLMNGKKRNHHAKRHKNFNQSVGKKREQKRPISSIMTWDSFWKICLVRFGLHILFAERLMLQNHWFETENMHLLRKPRLTAYLLIVTRYINEDISLVPMLKMLRDSGRSTFLVTNRYWPFL